MTPWMTVAEIAAYSRMHPQTIYRHMRAGRLPANQFLAHGVWRARPADVEAWLRRTSRAVAAPRRSA